MCDNNENAVVLNDSFKNVGQAAMLLALTGSAADEASVKRILTQYGYKFMVTQVGGKSSFDDFHAKINQATVQFAIDSGVVEHVHADIHALGHAIEEAKQGILVSVNTGTSVALKVAIVRSDDWLAVAMFGKSALHYTTNHDRAGLGLMHL